MAANTWVSMRVPAHGERFALEDGRVVRAVSSETRRYAIPPAVGGLVASLPETWTAAERDKWVAVFMTVLSYAIPVTPEANDAQK